MGRTGGIFERSTETLDVPAPLDILRGIGRGSVAIGTDRLKCYQADTRPYTETLDIPVPLF